MEARDIVLEIVSSHAPDVSRGDLLVDDLPLGTDGLGLDSIAIAEVLLECEVRFGVPLSHLLEAGEPLTIGRLKGHLEASAAP